jgi:hypothetical protein
VLFLRDLVDGGNVRAVVDRAYRLKQVDAAACYIESGQKTGPP